MQLWAGTEKSVGPNSSSSCKWGRAGGEGGLSVCLSVQYMTKKWARLMLETAPYIGLAFLYLFLFFYEHYSQLLKNQNV